MNITTFLNDFLEYITWLLSYLIAFFVGLGA